MQADIIEALEKSSGPAIFTLKRHPEFDTNWEKYGNLVFWWGVKLAKIYGRNQPRKYHYRDFLGILTLRFNQLLYHFTPDRGKFTTLFSWKIVGFVTTHMLRYESEWWSLTYRAANCDDKATVEGRAAREFHESDYFMYRVPDEFDEEWTAEIMDLFDTPQKVWAYLTDDLPERPKNIILWRFRDDLPLRECGERLGITKERVRQIEAKTLDAIRKRLIPLEQFRRLFSASTLDKTLE